MKKRIMSLMLILAMVAGVTLSLADHLPEKAAVKRFGKLIDQMGNVTWVDVTGLSQGLDYQCQGAEETCTTQFEGDNPANEEIISSRIPGHFQQ